MTSVVDLLREEVVHDLLLGKTVQKMWPTWRPRLAALLGATPGPHEVLALGEHLSEVFRSTSTFGRDQSSLSGGGVAWEALVCWYLNLALIGTDAVVIKKASQVPLRVRQALTVKYHTVRANTESDLVAVSFPEYTPQLHSPLRGKESALDRCSRCAHDRLNDLFVTVIQCKTNWNDNAQIPMLWDMIYKAQFSEASNIVVGENQAHLPRSRLRYAFVTVPSNVNAVYEVNTLCVQRVASLSGGTYWGQPTKNGVAATLSEIFAGARIGPQEGRGVFTSLMKSLRDLQTRYGYFDV